MARIRSIKPEFWTSGQVMDCSIEARLLFIGLWNYADDKGRMAVSAKRIKAQIFASDDITSASVRRMIDELATNGLIRLYVVDEVEYLVVTGWHHQKIDRPQPSKNPEPPEPNPPNDRRKLVDGRDLKGSEGKGEDPRKSGGGGSPPARTLNADAREAPAAALPPAEPPALAPAKPAAPIVRECDTAAGFDRIAQRCREVLPSNWGLAVEADARPVVQLVREGLDLETEIVPVLREVACRRTPIRTWPLLANAVAERVLAQRTARQSQGLSATPAAPPKPEEMIDLGAPYGAWSEPVLRQFVEAHRSRPGTWQEAMHGPPPGQPGCRIPSRLLIAQAA